MAATTAISGFSGSITGPTGFTEVTQWKLSVSQDKLDATNMGSAQYKEFVGGLSGAEGSCTTQGTVIPARGTLAACTLKTKSTGGATITGSIIVDKVDVGVPVDGKVTYDVSFAFSGSVSIT
ncbi:MAG: hypothetical protein WC359_14290 [Dehalococcoidia bacterium]|jgi:predicted secreted protein